jgi:hypothetical protein
VTPRCLPRAAALLILTCLGSQGCVPSRPADASGAGGSERAAAPGGAPARAAGTGPAAPAGSGPSVPAAGHPGRPDAHSYARPDAIRVTHLDIDWVVRFDSKTLEGRAALRIERGPEAGHTLHLDTRDLAIQSVTAWKRPKTRNGDDSAGWPLVHDAVAVPWHLGLRDPILGQKLVVEVPAAADHVGIVFRTSPAASGLQWLDPAQTAGAHHPFLYSQAQAIHARSFTPCQDSPGVRITYRARLHVPAPLRAVMAARLLRTAPWEPGRGAQGSGAPARPAAGEWRTFEFEMPMSIPSYLLALAVGDLAFAATGPRTGIWAEPSEVEKAAWEFADTEKMLESAETLWGPYAWGRYDILILPPSFPFGGMENPMMTFASPTVVAGDRSLVALVAHEMAHSWSGNLVTNATWDDGWINEGVTTYLERRIMEEIYGRDRADIEWVLGRHELDHDLATWHDAPADLALRLHLEGRDPDDVPTYVTYERGALFLLRLEQAYGRDAFDEVLRAWFATRGFSSATTDQFVAFLRQHLPAPKAPGDVPDLHAWVDNPALPADAPRVVSAALDRAADAMRRFGAGEAEARDLDTSGWSTQQWVQFLRTAPADLTAERMAALDAAFAFTRTGNDEILLEWLLLAIRHDYGAARPRLELFLTSVGRRRYVRPLYTELVKTDAGRRQAAAIFGVARPHYHAITQRMVEEILKPGTGPR